MTSQIDAAAICNTFYYIDISSRHHVMSSISSHALLSLMLNMKLTKFPYFILVVMLSHSNH